MDWNRSETLGLAKEGCALCAGTGIRDARCGQNTPCPCVFRSIFRACYARFCFCMNKEKYDQTLVAQFAVAALPGHQARITFLSIFILSYIHKGPISG